MNLISIRGFDVRSPSLAGQTGQMPGRSRYPLRLRTPSARSAVGTLLTLLLVVVLAACSSADAQPPNWVPKPSFQGDGGGNGVPRGQDGSHSAAPSTGPKGSQSAGPSGSNPPSSAADDPNVLAKNLTAPVGLVMLPDGTALVGERTTGRIIQVQATSNQPTPVLKTLSGLDASGDGGLLDLALSPTYAEDRLIYAYITTPTDNRVVDFTLSGAPTPVFIGIPKGATGNTGRLLFSTDGNLYIGTGDTAQPTLASNLLSLAGKVLRVNPVGQPVAGASSVVFTSGHHEVDGLCENGSGVIFDAESNTTDEINQLALNMNYGWPISQTASQPAVATAPAGKGGFGDCAVQGAQLYVTSRDGTDLLGAPLTGAAGTPTVGTLVSQPLTKYGRLKTVVAAPDGALWLTTTNKDGKGTPSADDERVIRILPQLGGADSPV